MSSDMLLSPLGGTIQAAEIDDGAVTHAKTGTDLNAWKLLETLTYTAEATKTTAALTAYTFYKIEMDLVSAANAELRLRLNEVSGANTYAHLTINGSTALALNGGSDTSALIGNVSNTIKTIAKVLFNGLAGAGGWIAGAVEQACNWGVAGTRGLNFQCNVGATTQVSTATIFSTQNLTGTVKIYGRN